MTGDTSTIYNASDGPLAIDRAGHMLAAGERLEVDTLEGLSGHIDASRIIVVDTPQADEDSPGDTTPRTRSKGRASTTQEG